MLVQHLLTRRISQGVFQSSDFTQRNIIAAEIEKVILALTSRSFSVDVFERSLNHFYLAIEESARGICSATITLPGRRQLEFPILTRRLESDNRT